MNWNNNGYGGYPPPPAPYGSPPYGGAPQQQYGVTPPVDLMSELVKTQSKLAELVSLNKTASNFPSQFHAGVIDWPNRYPFPMVLTQELVTSEGESYGTNNAEARTSFSLDVSNPTYITSIGFNLWRVSVDGQQGATTGWFLPLSGFRAPLIDVANQQYTGRDFYWSIFTSSNDIMWQTGRRSSDQANADDRRGYKLPIEYQARRNDVLIVVAQPLAPPVEDVVYRLEAVIHCYKMLQRE